MSTKAVIDRVPKENLKGKVVLVRVDFNVPLIESTAGIKVGDDTRIRASFPTIDYLTEANAKVILCSHLGRPRGKVETVLSLKPTADLLDAHGVDVTFVDECVGPKVEEAKRNLPDGHVLLLENLRFHKEETDNDPHFAQQLAQGVEIFVNDAFGSAHRAHASTVGVTKYIQRKYAGLLMEKELVFLGGALQNPERPLTAVVGGAKVSSKLEILQNLLSRVDKLLVGGGMVYTFYRALGYGVGDSIVEEALVPQADAIMKEAERRGVAVILAADCHIVRTSDLLKPHDTMGGTCMTETAISRTEYSGMAMKSHEQTSEGPSYLTLEAEVGHYVTCDRIPEGYTGVDIGAVTMQMFSEQLKDCKTVLWNGAMGICEKEEYSNGTRAIMRYISDLTAWGATTIVCGGETVAAVERERHNIDLVRRDTAARLGPEAVELRGPQKLGFSHVSTGGGAALEFLEGKELPGVAALDDAAGQQESSGGGK